MLTQLRSAAVSVCSNIAEGSSRSSINEKKAFFRNSRSSLVEIDTKLEISFIIEYIQNEQIKVLESYLERTFMMLTKMIEKLSIKTND